MKKVFISLKKDRRESGIGVLFHRKKIEKEDEKLPLLSRDKKKTAVKCIEQKQQSLCCYYFRSHKLLLTGTASTVRSMLSGRLQKKSMPVFSSNSLIETAYFANLLSLLFSCLTQNPTALYTPFSL